MLTKISFGVGAKIYLCARMPWGAIDSLRVSRRSPAQNHKVTAPVNVCVHEEVAVLPLDSRTSWPSCLSLLFGRYGKNSGSAKAIRLYASLLLPEVIWGQREPFLLNT